jgi:acetylglutamate kinase
MTTEQATSEASSHWLVDTLGQLVARPEALLYLERFGQLSQHRALLIRVDGLVVARQLDELAAALSFLHRLGLRPIVLPDLSEQITQARSELCEEGEADSEVINEALMARIRPLAYQQGAQLAQALEARGCEARSLQHGLFDCEWLDPERHDLRGLIAQINREPLESELLAGRSPILTCLGETASGQVLVLDGDQSVAVLAEALNPFKIVFLTLAGALRDQDERPISAISLTSDYDYLVVQSLVQRSMRERTGLIYRMLDSLESTSSVSVTRAADLVRELFTHSGSGTLLRKGEAILFQEIPRKSDLAMLPALLERCFHRRLDPAWLEQQNIAGLLMAESGRAAALLMRGHQSIPYLDKIMVTPEARGEGLGAALWQALRGRFPAMYWRSRSNNPINSWYFRRAQTTYRHGRWIVFTQGVTDYQLLETLNADAIARDSGWQDWP